MLADGGAEITKALGLELETGPFGGVRSKRYAMVCERACVPLNEFMEVISKNY